MIIENPIVEKTKTRRQHYVPQFYLKRFSNDKGKLWVFDKKTKKCFESITRDICYVDYLYEYVANDSAFSNGKHILPNDIENQFAESEGKWAQLVKTVLNKLSIQINPNALIITSKERNELYDFINNLLVRNPKAMAYFLSEEQFQKAFSSISDVEVIDYLFKEANFGDPTGFKKAMYKKLYFDSEKGLSYQGYFENMSYVFLKSESGKFITGDAPIRMDIDYDNECFKSIFFPLSPSYAINFFNVKTADRNRIRLIDENQVNDLNKYVFTYDENRFIISQDKETLIKSKNEVFKRG